MGQEDLAKERTELADERTLLSYVRTSLSVYVFAIVVEKFYPGNIYAHLIFLMCILFGTTLLFFGAIRFAQTLKKLKK